LTSHPESRKHVFDLAGLLTYPCLKRLPVDKNEQWQDCFKLLKGLTAAGTISDLHAIPYYSF
jgi:hypothetical protein